MSKKRQKEQMLESVEFPVAEMLPPGAELAPDAVVTLPPPQAAAAPYLPRPSAPAQRVVAVSFETWCRARGVRPHQMAGLVTHAHNVREDRTLEQWDQTFNGY